MKREDKNALSRQRILEAALREFSAKGYGGASFNALCAENEISKGIIYHYFKDKDELYLICVTECFQRLTAYLAEARRDMTGPAERRLERYFDRRLQFFAEFPLYLGIFTDATLNPPEQLLGEVTAARREFDTLNISVLTELLEAAPLRRGVAAAAAVEDFRMYMDYFNTRYRNAAAEASPEQTLRKHEERCHRQLAIFLYGVLEQGHEA